MDDSEINEEKFFLHTEPLLKPDQKVPELFNNGVFYLADLVKEDADRDFELIQRNADRIRGMFAYTEVLYDMVWPSVTEDSDRLLTYDENLRYLEGYVRGGRENRSTFAYKVMGKDGYIGCFYVYPPCPSSVDIGCDADVYLWLDYEYEDIDNILFLELLGWVQGQWSFERVNAPGRRID